jgi:hypothetical protein
MALSERTEPAHQGQQTGADSTKARQLFLECLAKEQRILITDFKASLPAVLKKNLLTRALFVDPAVAEYEPFKQLVRARFPFDFSMIKPRNLALPEPEWRKTQIVEYLKKLTDVELRLLLIARWLAEEGVCTAEDVLPKDVLHSLVERLRKARRISPTTVLHNALVRNWLPYFELLRADLKSKKHLRRCREEVAKLGHESSAIEWVSRKRSTIEAIFGWLGKRKNIDPRNLRNAYSRMQPHPYKDL